MAEKRQETAAFFVYDAPVSWELREPEDWQADDRESAAGDR